VSVITAITWAAHAAEEGLGH